MDYLPAVEPSKMHRFETFPLKNAVTLKPGLGVNQGHLTIFDS